MRIALFVPLHITAIQDIYMANMQSRFFYYAKKRLDIFSIMTIDEDQTNRFYDIADLRGTDALIDLRKENNYGIVVPTLKAIEQVNNEFLPCDIFIRITQDTQITDFEKFEKTIQNLLRLDKFICGRKDTCSDIKNYLKEIEINQIGDSYSFVQGNMIMASLSLWKDYYTKLPQSVKHYCDDSIFSYLCEHKGGIKPIFIENDFWKENRTKDVYYLESLYKEENNA